MNKIDFLFSSIVDVEFGINFESKILFPFKDNE